MYFNGKKLALQYYANVTPMQLQSFLDYFHDLEVSRVTYVIVSPLEAVFGKCRIELFVEEGYADLLIASFTDGVLSTIAVSRYFCRARSEQLSLDQIWSQKAHPMAQRVQELLKNDGMCRDHLTVQELLFVDQSLGMYVEKVLHVIDTYVPPESGYMEIARVLRFADLHLSQVHHQNISLQQHMREASRKMCS